MSIISTSTPAFRHVRAVLLEIQRILQGCNFSIIVCCSLGFLCQEENPVERDLPEDPPSSLQNGVYNGVALGPQMFC